MKHNPLFILMVLDSIMLLIVTVAFILSLYLGFHTIAQTILALCAVSMALLIAYRLGSYY